MNDHILNDCLTRIAQGESVASCLACYPEQAAELEPYLQIAAELRPSDVQISADEDARIEAQMRTAFRARHKNPPVSTSIFSRYTQQQTRLIEKIMPTNDKSGRGWVTLGNALGLALAVVMLIGGWFLFDRQQVQEVAPFSTEQPLVNEQPTEPPSTPSVTEPPNTPLEPTTIPTVVGESVWIELFGANVVMATTLPEGQAMPVYDVAVAPISAETLRDIAQRLNIPDPIIYESNNLMPQPDQGTLLMGSNGESLQVAGFNLIRYTNVSANVPTDAPALTEDATGKLVEQFFSEIGYLPDDYQIKPFRQSQQPSYLQQVQIVPLIDGHPLRVDGYQMYVTVHPSGGLGCVSSTHRSKM